MTDRELLLSLHQKVDRNHKWVKRQFGSFLHNMTATHNGVKKNHYYLHEDGPNLGKHRVTCLLLPSTLDAQFGTPYPRSAGFDTDIGAFIESSSVSSPLGLMASSIIDSDAV